MTNMLLPQLLFQIREVLVHPQFLEEVLWKLHLEFVLKATGWKNKAEMKTETGDVFGSYSVLMPDGYIYTTTYNVTGDSGYVSRLVKTLAVREDIPEPRLPVEQSSNSV